MKKSNSVKVSSGITIHTLEKEKKGQIGAKLHISLKATLLCLVTISIIEILSTSYFIPYNDIVVYGLMIAFGAALCFAFEHKQYRIIGLVAGAAFILLFGVMMGSQVKRGFMEVVQLVIDRVNTTGAVSIPELQLAYNVRSESDITIFMCVASIAIVYLLSIGIVLVRNLLIVVCVTLPLLEIGIYYGVLPSYIWYGILIACWCTLFALELPRSQAEEDHSGTYMGFALLAISLVAMVVITVVIPKSSYDKSPKFAKLRQELTDNGTNPLFSRFGSHLTGASSTANGGLGEGKLGNVDKINFSGKTALVVTCPNVADTVYLKGFVAADYEGNEWNNYNDENQWQRYDAFFDETKFYPLNQLADTFIKERKSNPIFAIVGDKKLKVQVEGANAAYMYQPYGAKHDATMDSFCYQDLYMENKNQKREYEFTYCYDSRIIDWKSVTLRNEEDLMPSTSGMYGYNYARDLYEEYIQKYYTTLPEGTYEQLIEDAKKLKAETSSDMEYAEFLQDYFEAYYEYTLSPGKLPKGKDFVNYFLYESKKGYCTYFASAATLMYRAVNIPSRYVEGYVITKENFQNSQKNKDGTVTMEITDQNAHAWVEIYLKGIGWIPIEVTKGGSSAAQLADEAAQKEATTTKKQENTEKKEEKQATNKPSKKTEQGGASTSEKEKPLATPKKDTSNQENNTPNHLGKLVVIVVAALFILLVSFLPIRYMYGMGKRRKMETKENNKVMLYYYKMQEEILKFMGGSSLEEQEELRKNLLIATVEYEDFYQLALKARFSPHTLTKEEVMVGKTYLCHLSAAALSRLKGFKRFVFIFWRHLNFK